MPPPAPSALELLVTQQDKAIRGGAQGLAALSGKEWDVSGKDQGCGGSGKGKSNRESKGEAVSSGNSEEICAAEGKGRRVRRRERSEQKGLIRQMKGSGEMWGWWWTVEGGGQCWEAEERGVRGGVGLPGGQVVLSLASD